MALDQATQALLAQFASGGGKPLHEMDPIEARQLSETLSQLSGPGPEVAQVRDETLAGADGGTFRVRVLVPKEKPAGVILYSHGGGWVIGNIDGFDTLGRVLAKKTGCAVVLVDYRKAPENPYPTAIEDAWRALLWVDENLQAIAGRRVPLIVAGDSAGGNISAALALRARDRSGPKIAQQVLVYPVTDHDFGNPSYVDPANQLLLSRESMVWFWNHYCPADRRSEPDASPLRAASLAGLPPAVVLIAEHDVLRHEGETYAVALEAAGVPVQQKLFAGQMHGFFTMVNLLPGSAEGIDYVAQQVNALVAGEGRQEAAL